MESVPFESLDPGDPEVLPRIARILRAIGDPLRLRILLALQRGERCVSELVAATGTTQTNVSKHLAILRAGGLVATRKAGARIFYSVADTSLEGVCTSVCQVLQAQLERERQVRARLEVRAAGDQARDRGAGHRALTEET